MSRVERYFGRLPDPETPHAAEKHPMSRALVAPVPVTHKIWTPGPTLDQGRTPMCVGYAWEGWMLASPTRTKDGPSPPEIYSLAQSFDGFPGPHDGSSTLGGARAMSSLGRMGEFVWAANAAEIRQWVLTHGPVVVGSDWYEGMLDTDRRGFVSVYGSVIDGHEWLVIGYSRSRNAFRALNSWDGWGQNGRFWISFRGLDTLITTGGDACAAVEKKV